MIRTQIQLTEEQMKSLKRLSIIRHVSIARLVRESIDNLLKSNPVADDEEVRNRAINAAGKFRSSLGDLSKRHDFYLNEDYGS